MKRLSILVFLTLLVVLTLFTLAALAADPAGALTAPDVETVSNVVVAIVTAIIVALPLIVWLLKQTAWGKANAAALDELVDAVGKARRESPIYAEPILKTMKDKEKTAPPDVVRMWKAAVLRRDPK
jgi:hypothetical protein